MTPDRAPIVYLHGQPGSPDELQLVTDPPVDIFAPDLRHGPLWPQIEARFPDGPITLIGFSLGAFQAIRLAARHPDRVTALHLIAPPAPLDSGDFLDLMAGGALFRLARDHPRLFRWVTAGQALIARLAPALLFRALFATAQGDDARLAADPDFARGWARNVRRGFADGGRAYAQIIAAYVQPWADDVAKVQAPSCFWVGDADNWVPPAMSRALAHLMPLAPDWRVQPGASHYSTLKAAILALAAPD